MFFKGIIIIIFLINISLGLLPPKYVRAINLDNQTNTDISVIATFKSGTTETYNIPPNGNTKISREINQGTFKTVDPIEKLEVSSGEIKQVLTFDPQGVEIRNYQVKLVENTLTFELLP